MEKATPLVTLPSAEAVRDVLDYDPDTGVFRWKHSRRGVTAGSLAGTRHPDGRLEISVLGRRHKAARIAWLLVTGLWPVGEVDHRDTNPADDRFSNLRDVPHSVNMENQRRPQRSNTHGHRGAGAHRGKFQARISVAGKNLYLGSFDTAEEASSVYVEAKRRLHAGCTL